MTERSTAPPGADLDDLTRGLAQLRAVIEAQAMTIEAQAATVASLQHRLERMEGALEAPPDIEAHDREGAATPPDPGDCGEPSPRSTLTGPTTRRNLMSKGAAAAAGAAIAGTVLSAASASPAAAASGVFDGDPAVSATTLPAGTAVRGVGDGGIGILGRTKTGEGVRGEAAGNGTGVIAISTTGIALTSQTGAPSAPGFVANHAALTGEAIAISAVSSSPTCTVVRVRAPSTVGPTVGLSAIASSTSGSAIVGTASAADGNTTGVVGATASPNGTAVLGQSPGTAVAAFSSRTQLFLGGGPSPPLSVAALRRAGEVVLDDNLDLWLCVAEGSPGTWTRIGGANTTGALTVLAATARIYDSRPGTQPPTGTKTKFASGEARVMAATGNSSGVPASATAVMISAAATNTNPGGFFSFFKTGITFPGNSNLNWGLPNSTVAVTTVVACGTNATFNARMQGSGGADLVIDVIGYYL